MNSSLTLIFSDPGPELKMTDEKQQIIDFLENCSLEVTPGGARKISSFREILKPGTTVFTTFLHGSDFNDTIATTKRLADEGMNPVPHFAARSTPSRKILEENLVALRDQAGINEALIIAGGVDNHVGEFTSTMELLKTGLFQKYGIEKIGVAGHPEGNPDISDAMIKQALLEKNTYAREHQLEMYLVTQFCFEPGPVIEWDKRIKEEGNQLPVNIGIPGLATIRTLLNHARACGVGPSIRVLTRQAANVTKLMTTRTPDKLVRALANYRATNPECAITRCHLYPLGGLKKSAAWLYAVQDGSFELNDAGGFDLTVKLE